MIISKDKQGNWVPTAGGTGTFIGTLAAFNAIKDTLPVNTVAYITDDGNGDLQPVDAVTNGDMHPVTSNAVYDALNTVTTGNATILSGASVDPADTVNFITWYKRGGVVTVRGRLDVVSTPTFLSKVAEGLPIPIDMFWPVSIIFDETGRGLAFQLNALGELSWDHGYANLVNGAQVFFTFTYIAA